MAGLPDDFNEDDFEDFNPHPYLGGYDIAKTYGEPLPPSPAICYPISFSVSSPPVGEGNLSPDSVPVKEANGEPEPVPAPVVEPEKPVIAPVVEQPWFKPHEYGEPYQPEPYKPDLFRSWPFSTPKHCCHNTRKGQVRDFDYWNHMMRGLDFLFGHAQGYGERRVGTDVYGIPIYANKRSTTESVAVHMEHPPVQRLEYHQESGVQVHPDGLDSHMQWPSWYEERKEEKNNTYGNNYPRDDYYDYKQRTSDWYHDSSYRETYHDQSYNSWGYSSNVEEESREENKMFSTPVYSYNKHYHEQPLHVQVEPTDQTWTQKMISYENNHSSYYERGEEGHQLNILSHGYERERYEQTQYEPLEPFKPSWSQNLGGYDDHLGGEIVRSEDYSTFYGGGNGSLGFAYNEGNIYHERNQSSWSTGDGHVLYGEGVSNKPNCDDDPSNWTDAIFGPSRNYYAYDH